MVAAKECLRWRTGALGCIVPLSAMIVAVIACAALRPSLAAELATARRGALISMTQSMTVGGVNVPLAMLALYLCFEVFRLARRWIDVDAVIATDDAILFHPTTRLLNLPWKDVESVRIGKVRYAPSLIVGLIGGDSRVVRGIDDDHAAAFIAFAQSRIDRIDGNLARP